tara:strand:- start:560 stop:868 length:309 start_codon:yes stop_codon:yes gene_type:complete
MLIKDLSIRTAIEQLDPTAGFELTKDNVLLNWNSSVRSQPTDEEINKKFEELKVDYDSKEHQRLRKYPPIEEQLDMLYWDRMNGTERWIQAIKSVKDKHPKK